MNILVLGGTRFFGIPMVEALLAKGHQVTIATRQNARDSFGDRVKRIKAERTDAQQMKEAFAGMHFDVVYDKIAYCSNDIKSIMEAVSFDKYIYMSSTAVYEPKTLNTKEEDWNPLEKELIWCDRGDFPYDEIKRQAECALWQVYGERRFIAVRYPFVIGKDDYTGRLKFYVEHIMQSRPMKIDNLDAQMGFITSKDAGEFLAFLADKDYHGALNGACVGSISIRELLTYVEDKTGVKAIVSSEGQEAPYNGEAEYSINVDKAGLLGYRFTKLKSEVYSILDEYIKQLRDKYK